jgi:hypothetical protein
MRNISIVFVIALLVCTVSWDMFFHTWEHGYKYTESSIKILLAISSLIVMTLFIIIRCYERNNKAVTRKEKLTLLIQNSCSGSITDIAFVLAFLVFLNLLPTTVVNYIDGNTHLLSVLTYIIGFILLIFGKPTFKKAEPIKDEERKMLVSGISKVSLVKIKDEIKSNLEPVLSPFGVFPNIEKVAIILTNDFTPSSNYTNDEIHDNLAILSKGYIVNYPNSENKLKDLREFLQACIKTYPLYKDKKVDIEFSNEVDYNSFKDCNDESVRFIKEEMGRRYEDKNIIVNITPGTKTLTGVMTLNAIKGERLMIYIGQKDNNLIKDETPSVSLIQFTDWKKDIEKLG